MRRFVTSSRCHLVMGLLLVALSLEACQRASYSFQNPVGQSAVPLASASQVDSFATMATHSPQALLAVVPRRWPQRMVGQTTARLRPSRQLRLPTAPAAKPAARQALESSTPLPTPLPTDLPVRMRTRGIAFLLALLPALLLFPIGLHQFYLGYHVRGVLTLLALGLGFVLAVIGIIMAFGNGAVNAALIAAAVLVYGAEIWQLTDSVRILLNKLKPKDGEYYPRFFQTRSSGSAPR